MPEDDTNDLLRALRAGDMEPGTEVGEAHRRDTDAQQAEMPSLPAPIARVLASPDRAELIEVAKMLDQCSKRERFIIFYTPIGDIRCRINWQSCEPENLRGSDSIFFVKMRSSDVAFTPKSGATFEIGFAGYSHTFSVVCLAPPQQLYPGVDLMCFLPNNSGMEKNGKLKAGMPSVVSGAPSDQVSLDGEPIVDGEKSASTQDFDRARDDQD